MNIDAVMPSDSQYYYHHNSPPYIASCSTQAHIDTYDDTIHDHIDQVRNCYFPGRSTVLQPVLILDQNQKTSGGYQWTTLVYQQTLNQIHVPRYDVDICTINPHIQHCTV